MGGRLYDGMGELSLNYSYTHGPHFYSNRFTPLIFDNIFDNIFDIICYV